MLHEEPEATTTSSNQVNILYTLRLHHRHGIWFAEKKNLIERKQNADPNSNGRIRTCNSDKLFSWPNANLLNQLNDLAGIPDARSFWVRRPLHSHKAPFGRPMPLHYYNK